MNIVVIERWIDLFGDSLIGRWKMNEDRASKQTKEWTKREKKRLISQFENIEPSHLVWATIKNWKTQLYTHDQPTDRLSNLFIPSLWFAVVLIRFYLYFFAVHHNIFFGLLDHQFAIYVWCSTAFLIQFCLVFRSKSNVFFLQVSPCYDLTTYSKIFKCDFIIGNRRDHYVLSLWIYTKIYSDFRFVFFLNFYFCFKLCKLIIFRKWTKHVNLTCRVFIDVY